MPNARMRLSVTTPEQLDWAIRHSDEVAELLVGAQLVRDDGFRRLLPQLKSFPDLAKVWIEDDYLDAADMSQIASQMETQHPGLVLAWLPGAYVDGKHGR